MATLRQIEAIRLNSQRSTGPRTEQGKAVSSRNNLTHGLRAATVVLPEENQEDFDAECQELFDHFQPQGPVERHLLEQMADYRWKAVRRTSGLDPHRSHARAVSGHHPRKHRVVCGQAGAAVGTALSSINGIRPHYKFG